MKKVSITKKDVERMAELSRLLLSEKEKEKISGDLASILDFIDKLNEVDVSLVEYSQKNVLLKNIQRKDKAEPTNPDMVDEMVSQFLEKEKSFLKVKEILSNA